MSLEIETVVAGPLETNAYVVVDEVSREALVIDAPPESLETIMAALKRRGGRATMLVITHAHWDHIGDAARLAEQLSVPVAAHDLAVARLASPGSSIFELPFVIPPVKPDRLLADGDEVSLGENHTLVVMHLPGHDPGHIALYSAADKVFLGGDVLFPGGHGRIDVPGASEADMAASLRRLADFPPDVTVYPGHGRPTTIGQESWLQGFRKGA